MEEKEIGYRSPFFYIAYLPSNVLIAMVDKIAFPIKIT
jgi:hypothetical protein